MGKRSGIWGMGWVTTSVVGIGTKLKSEAGAEVGVKVKALTVPSSIVVALGAEAGPPPPPPTTSLLVVSSLVPGPNPPRSLALPLSSMGASCQLPEAKCTTIKTAAANTENPGNANGWDNMEGVTRVSELDLLSIMSIIM